MVSKYYIVYTAHVGNMDEWEATEIYDETAAKS